MDSGFIPSLSQSLGDVVNVDPSMIISIIVRTLLISLILIFLVKWLGSKGVGQLTTYEMIIILGLGNVLGEPMVSMEISIPQMFTSVIIIVMFFKLLDYLTTKNGRLGRKIQPNIIPLVKDGQIKQEGLEKSKISLEEFKSHMRLQGIRDISQIDESNLEINGQISFIRKSAE